MRLRGTVVLYDGEPYYVLAITDHKPDGIFRIYLEPTGWDPNIRRVRPDVENYSQDDPSLGKYCDDWLTANPKSGVLRKHMSSPLFNKFRPFPLGMCNSGRRASYVERMPNRKTEQGLIRTMVQETPLTTSQSPDTGIKSGYTDVFGIPFRACILGDHPSAQEVIAALKDPSVENESVAFHREFALVRGPIDMIFLAYKQDIVGVLPNGDLGSVRLGRKFQHVKEAAAELGVFASII